MTATYQQAGLAPATHPQPPSPDDDRPMWGVVATGKESAVEAARRALDGFKRRHGVDATYLRVGHAMAARLVAAGFDADQIVPDTAVGYGVIYAGRA